MEKIINYLDNYFVPIAHKIGAQRHLVAIRDGFIALMPLVITGSLAVLLNSVLFKDKNGGGLIATWFDIDAAQNGLWNFFGTQLVPIMGNLWWGTFAILALVLVFTIAYSLARSYDVSPLSTAVVAIAGYIALTPQGVPDTWGNIGWQYTNFGALLTAVVISLVISEIFIQLMRRNITIKLPENVPPQVGRAFAAIIPGLVAILVGAMVPIVLAGLGTSLSIYEVLNKVTDPLLALGQNVFAAMVYVFFIGLFWFFGLHGGNMLGAVTNAVYLPPLGENQVAFDAGQAMPHIFTPAFFDSFVHLGGAGASIALLIVIFLASRRKDHREISKIALGGSVFQINEPVMYGLPVVLNPLLLIPFLLIPMILTFNAWLWTSIGIAGKTYVAIPWVTPPILGAYLSTGGSLGAALIALMNLAIACILYYPFVLLSNKHSEEVV